MKNNNSNILDQFKDFKKKKDPKTSALTQKVVTILVFISFIMFAKFSPYGGERVLLDSVSKEVFYLYFFIVSQTLGIVHEGGHGICYIFHCPEFITALNGTLFQLAFPLGIGYYYKKQGNTLAYLIGLFIFGISLQYTAWYISTAHQGLFLPASKSFLGVDGKHDFNYILSQMGLLSYNGFIAGLLKFIAYILMIYVCLKMFFISFISSSNKKGTHKV